MPQIKDIFEKENGRLTSGDMNAVYLYPEGTFYRAYEWSAWLCCRYISQFKATRREIKSESGQTMVFVGFTQFGWICNPAVSEYKDLQSDTTKNNPFLSH